MYPGAQLAGAAQRAQGGVPAPLHVHFPVVARPAEEPAVELRADVGEGAAHREREADAGVPQDAGLDGRAAAGAAAEAGPEVHRALGVPDPLIGIGREEPGVAGAQERKAKLDTAAGLLPPPEVADGVARAGIEERDGARDAALADGRIGVAQREVVDVLAELPLELAALAPAEQVRLLQSKEPTDSGALPQRSAEVDVARPALLDPEGDVDVDPVGRWLDVGIGERLLEESLIGDVLL